MLGSKAYSESEGMKMFSSLALCTIANLQPRQAVGQHVYRLILFMHLG